MAKKHQSLAELRAENRLLRQANITTGVTSVAKTAIKFGALVWISYHLYLSIEVLAGRTTLASVAIQFLGNLTVSQSLAYIFGTGGIAYGLGERWVRKRRVDHLGGRIKELEAAIDPHRSSSNPRTS